LTTQGWTIGEIQTSLIQNSVPASAALCDDLLAYNTGGAVAQSARPQHRATSVDLFTGVDCTIPTGGRKVRGVGTVVSRGSITGGRLVQATAWTTVVTADSQRRLPWSDYLTRRGVVESIGAVELEDVARAHLATDAAPGQLNLAAISLAVHDRMLVGPGPGSLQALDRRPPMRPDRTSLRFAIGASAGVTLAIDGRTGLRKLTLPDVGAPLVSMVALCEDLARHDWLLTTVLAELTVIDFRPRHPQSTRRLTAVLETLGHLWFPAARLAPALADLWYAIDGRLEMSRQWLAVMTHVRDLLLLAGIDGRTSTEQGKESTRG
jgi:hypothetical protein